MNTFIFSPFFLPFDPKYPTFDLLNIPGPSFCHKFPLSSTNFVSPVYRRLLGYSPRVSSNPPLHNPSLIAPFLKQGRLESSAPQREDALQLRQLPARHRRRRQGCRTLQGSIKVSLGCQQFPPLNRKPYPLFASALVSITATGR